MPLPTTPRRSMRSSRLRSRAGSMSMTVMSFCSETRLSATLSPTRPAPRMMMFMVSGSYEGMWRLPVLFGMDLAGS